MNIKYYTFGCKVNQYETELLKKAFESAGHREVKSGAELFVINSCTVTGHSDLKLRQLVHRIRRENPSAVIALCGCFPQAFRSAAEAVPEADIILGTFNKHELPAAVEEFLKTGQRTVKIVGGNREYPAAEALSGFENKTRGIIKIQDGCDRFCSYCIIPYSRGRSRSKPIESIRAEAKALADSGHKEIVIVGINLSNYKSDGHDLADAVTAAARSGAERIRLGSLEPEEFTMELAEKLSKIDNLCPHFHLALQSGCGKTLKEMNRKYDKEEYFTLVNRLRQLFPGCAITTDIMVGFPGETDADFNESLEFVKLITFAGGHVFPYSPRKGTPAALRGDQVSPEIKQRRAEVMAKAVEESEKEYRKSLVGTVQRVLFEKEKAPDYHQGHSSNYQLVKVKHFTDTLFREMRDVKITTVGEDCLYGEIVQR